MTGKRKKMPQKSRKKRNPGWYFLLPELFGVALFGLIPFADVVRRSFFQTADNSFVGFDNYFQVVKNSAFRLAARNTIHFVVVCIPCLLILSLLLALLLQQLLVLAEKKKKHRDVSMEQFYRNGTAVLKSIYLLPMAIPAASVVVLWKLLFDNHGFLNGVLDTLLQSNGIGQLLNYFSVQTKDWMNTDAAFGILVFSYIWKYLGYDIVLWLAGLSAIPESIYEAAEVDGAGKWKTFFYITLPNLRPVAFTVVILSVLNSFKAFREVYMVAGSYPQENIYLLQHVFNNWFQTLSMDKMAAASVLLSVIIAVFVLLLERSWEREDN